MVPGAGYLVLFRYRAQAFYYHIWTGRRPAAAGVDFNDKILDGFLSL